MELLLFPGGLRTFLISGDLAYLEGKELEACAFFTTKSVVLSHYDARWSVDLCCPTSRIMWQGLICKCRTSVILSAQQWTPALHYSVFCMVQFIYLPVAFIF